MERKSQFPTVQNNSQQTKFSHKKNLNQLQLDLSFFFFFEQWLCNNMNAVCVIGERGLQSGRHQPCGSADSSDLSSLIDFT